MKGTYSGAKRRGFSLTEMLVVVLIMGILVGVVGSLMGGFMTNFERTDDQSIARRRAQDVFNILQTPILNAGLGIPPTDFDYYFGPTGVSFSGAPIQNWTSLTRPIGPIQVIPSSAFNASEDRGDVLRVVYSIYSGVKNVSSADIDDFSASESDETNNNTGIDKKLPLNEAPPIGGGDGIQFATAGTSRVHSYVTFPGLFMHPAIVRGYTSATKELDLYGKTPLEIVEREGDVSGDVLPRNQIRPYHDMLLVRAALAYVDNKGTFCLYDINDDSPNIGSTLPTAAAADAAGKLVYRVEGIKAVRFEEETGTGGGVTSVNVFVLAEGDNAITERRTNTVAVNELRNRWPGINWNDEMYYEDFEMRWRTRNIEAPTTP